MKFFASLLFLLFTLSGCKFPPYDQMINEEEARMGHDFNATYYQADGRKLYTVYTGEPKKPAILFIHGAPGNWKAWGRYLGDADLNKVAFMISVDRPGYGASDLGSPLLDVKKQTKIIMDAAKEIHSGPFILVGHSYGGPIQIQAAIDYPDDVANLLILAGAIDPDLHGPRWYHRLGQSFIGQAFLSKMFKVTNLEMHVLDDELKKQQDDLSKIKAPITIIQGKKDWLVPPGNVDYAVYNINTKIKVISLLERGHFLPWNEYDLVKNEIIQIIN